MTGYLHGLECFSRLHIWHSFKNVELPLPLPDVNLGCRWMHRLGGRSAGVYGERRGRVKTNI